MAKSKADKRSTKSVTVWFEHRPDIQELLNTLHGKTNIKSNVEIIALALKQLNSNLPAGAVPQPMERVAH